MASLLLNDFSGGLNLRDSVNELSVQPMETPDATNWTLDERGALRWRNGCTNAATLPGVVGKEAFLFYSSALNLWLCARETTGAPNTFKLHTRPGDLSGSWTDRGTINSTVTSTAAFIDFPIATAAGPVVVITTDGNGATRGIWTLNGAFTLTNVSGNAIEGDFQGSCIALWQDRAIVAGYPLSGTVGNPTSLFACAPKDPTKWTVANGGWTQQIREKDADTVTNLGVTGGALVAFKKRSAYRVNDSATGAYTTIDPNSGCQGSQALAALKGRLYVWGMDSIYECDGVGPLKDVGGKLLPLFTRPDNVRSIVAGVKDNRAIFAYNGTSGANQPLTRLIELNPQQGWSMLHQVAMSGAADARFTSMARKGRDLYAATKVDDVLLGMFDATQGSDAGNTFPGSTYLTPWIQPNSGMLARLQRIRVQGLLQSSTSTTLALAQHKDWSRTDLDSFQIETPLRAADANQDTLYADIQSLGHATAFQFKFSAAPAAGGGEARIRGLQLVTTALQYPNPGYPVLTGNRPSLSSGLTRSDNPSPPPMGPNR